MNFIRLLFLLLLTNKAIAEYYVSNPSFESVENKASFADWSWWERERGKGKIEASSEAHAGTTAIHITHEGDKDWNVSNSLRTKVIQGESFKLTCWMMLNTLLNAPYLEVVGCKGKEVVDWAIGRTSSPSRQGWNMQRAYFVVPEGVDTIYVRITGHGKTDALVDELQLVKAPLPIAEKKPKVEGWLGKRPVEPMGRGLVACQVQNGIYIGWRLLKDDPADRTFDLYRTLDGQRIKLNSTPLKQATDYTDTNTFHASAHYSLATHPDKSESASILAIPLENRKTPYICIPLATTNAVAQKIGIADLDGDGVYDYVIKQPGGNVDPYEKYWYKSPETFKIEARKQDGTLLWIKDLGWNIERGMWYSPMIVCDLTGDGRAEVAVKIGPEEDCRDAEGKVAKGAEWVAILDGLTGKEITRAPWPSRDRFPSYNYSSRNQLAIAYLDGRTPCLIVLRGTYNVMIADAYQLRDSKLEKLWSYSNEDLPGNYQGQGAHNCLCADIDSDGRDEVLLGSITLDDDGSVLWTTGKGHPDAHYLGDIDPLRPGLEMAYIIERKQTKGGGIHLLDPTTGKIIWQLNEPTEHVHSCGICSDLDPLHAGLEIYGADSRAHESTGKRWLFASNGKLLKSGSEVDYKFGIPSAYWDADLQRELIRGKAEDFDGCNVSERIEGSVVLVADVLGDWREEVITSLPGEVRIYTSPIPAMDRRVCLIQDTLYRMRTTMNAMGYMQVPLLSYVPEARSPNINITLMRDGKKQLCRIVVSAPGNKGIKGTLSLTAPPRIILSENTKTIDLQPNERIEMKTPFEGAGHHGEAIHATLTLEDSPPLSVYAPFDL
jgi:rhamnogalacturonan endolyase